MAESKKKIIFPKDAFSLGIIISLLVFVIFSLVDTLIYYFSDAMTKFSTTMFSFLSICLLAGVVLLAVLKGKKLLASIFFLLTIIVDRGLAFIRNLIFGAVSLSTFDDFYQFLALVILVYLVLVIILQLKKERPKLTSVCPRDYLLPLLVISYNLIFNGFNSTLAMILVFAVLFLCTETQFIGWYVAARFIFGVGNIIDFIVLSSKVEGYKQPFGFWMSNILIISLFVMGVIAIFKPQFFVLKKKVTSPLLHATGEASEKEAREKNNDALEKVEEGQEKVDEPAEKVEYSEENLREE